MFRNLGDYRMVANLLSNLGDVAADQADYLAARGLFAESVAIYRGLRAPRGLAEALERLAFVEFGLTEPGRAARIWGAAERMRQEIGSPLPPNERLRYDRRVAKARAAIGDDSAFDSAWQEGRAMTRDQALHYALEGRNA